MIIIETSNAAFDDHECGEVSRILRTFCRELPDVLPPGTNGLYDINGNTCGRVEITRND
jgi:hypothetical protein